MCTPGWPVLPGRVLTTAVALPKPFLLSLEPANQYISQGRQLADSTTDPGPYWESTTGLASTLARFPFRPHNLCLPGFVKLARPDVVFGACHRCQQDSFNDMPLGTTLPVRVRDMPSAWLFYVSKDAGERVLGHMITLHTACLASLQSLHSF